MEVHTRAVLVLALFFLFLSIPLSKDSVGLVYADEHGLRVQGEASMKMNNGVEDKGSSRDWKLGIRKLMEDDISIEDYAPAGPNPAHDPPSPSPPATA